MQDPSKVKFLHNKIIKPLFLRFLKKFEGISTDRQMDRQSTVLNPPSVSQKEIASIFKYTTNQLTMHFPDNDEEVRYFPQPEELFTTDC